MSTNNQTSKAPSESRSINESGTRLAPQPSTPSLTTKRPPSNNGR